MKNNKMHCFFFFARYDFKIKKNQSQIELNMKSTTYKIQNKQQTNNTF